MRSYLCVISATAGAFLVATEVALAGDIATVPGPVAAIGAPALLIIGGAFLAVRYLRTRRK